MAGRKSRKAGGRAKHSQKLAKEASVSRSGKKAFEESPAFLPPPIEVLKRLIRQEESLVSTLQLQVWAGTLSNASLGPCTLNDTNQCDGTCGPTPPDTHHSDMILKPPLLLPSMLKTVAASRPPRVRDDDRCDSLKKASSRRSCGTATRSVASYPCRIPGDLTASCDSGGQAAAAADASLSMDAWVHEVQPTQPPTQPPAPAVDSRHAHAAASRSAAVMTAMEEADAVVVAGTDDDEEYDMGHGDSLGGSVGSGGVPAHPLVQLSDSEEDVYDVVSTSGSRCRRMRHVCSTVAEGEEEAVEAFAGAEGEEEGAEDEEDTEWSGQDGEVTCHRRYLSGQSCSTGYSSADGSEQPAGGAGAGGRLVSAKDAGRTGAARGGKGSGGGSADLLPMLSMSPPAYESCTSGVSLSPTHSHGSSLCPLSPVQLSLLPPPPGPKAIHARVPGKSAWPQAPTGTAGPHTTGLPPPQSQQQQQQQQPGGSAQAGMMEGVRCGGQGADSLDTPVSICRTCRKLRFTGSPAQVRAWLASAAHHAPGAEGSSADCQETLASGTAHGGASLQRQCSASLLQQEDGDAGAADLDLSHVSAPMESVHRLVALWEAHVTRAQQQAQSAATAAAAAATTTGASVRTGAGKDAGATAADPPPQPGVWGAGGVAEGALGARLCCCKGAFGLAPAASSAGAAADGHGGWGAGLGAQQQQQQQQQQELQQQQEQQQAGAGDGDQPGGSCGHAGPRQRRSTKHLGRFLGALGGGSRSNSPWAVVLTLAVLPWVQRL